VQEARSIAGLFSRRLSQLSFDYIQRSFNGDDTIRVRKLVKFDAIEVLSDQYRMHVDSMRLPRGRGITEFAMAQDDVVMALGFTIKRPVAAHLEPGVGLWFLVDREHGIGNIPTLVEYKDVWNIALQDKQFKTVASIPAGLTGGRKIAMLNMADEKAGHLLIGGVPGSGKSSLLHALICTLARQSPDEVKLALFDFKRVEFKPYYRNLPHLLYDIVVDPVEAYPKITHIRAEVDKRYKQMETVGVEGITEYNARQVPENRLPHIFMIIDELAAVMINPLLSNSDKGDIEGALGYVAMQGRAAGVHLVLATQRPDARVLTGYIRACVPCKIAFACASLDESKIIIGNGHAAFKDKAPVGRAILVHSRYEIPFQAAWINPDQRRAIVADALVGRSVPKRHMTHDVTIQELARYALRNWGGVFKQSELYYLFKLRGITDSDVRYLKDLYSHEAFEMDGEMYLLTQPAPRKPYIIQKVAYPTGRLPVTTG
jgi:hypothetical protein